MRFIEATVDVQGGKNRRFVVQITGYGEQGERWIVDRYNLRHSLRCGPGGESLPVDPAAYPEDWDLLLTDVFHKTWPLASDPDVHMRLMAMAVDTGGEAGVTDNAYRFWRQCRREGLGNRVFLFKGDQSILSGAAVVVGSMVAVAITDIPAGETGDGFAEGVFLLPKQSADDIQAGVAVYLKDGTVQSAADGAVAAGMTWEHAPSGTTTVAVKINA